jgi:hypothetical protein
VSDVGFLEEVPAAPIDYRVADLDFKQALAGLITVLQKRAFEHKRQDSIEHNRVSQFFIY